MNTPFRPSVYKLSALLLFAGAIVVGISGAEALACVFILVGHSILHTSRQ